MQIHGDIFWDVPFYPSWCPKELQTESIKIYLSNDVIVFFSLPLGRGLT
jgi:hypothetical protein